MLKVQRTDRAGSRKQIKKDMKALITTRTETSITTSEIVLRGKPQTQNQKIAEEVERRINKELYYKSKR